MAKPKAINGIRPNWETKPIRIAFGFFKTVLKSPHTKVEPIPSIKTKIPASKTGVRVFF